jgi:hypothetical protein
MTVNIFRGKNVEKQNWTHNGCEQMLSALRRKKNEIGRMGTYLSHTDRPTDRQTDRQTFTTTKKNMLFVCSILVKLITFHICSTISLHFQNHKKFKL